MGMAGAMDVVLQEQATKLTSIWTCKDAYVKGLLKSPLFADHKSSTLFRKEVVGSYFQRKKYKQYKPMLFPKDNEVFNLTEACCNNFIYR